MSTLLNMLFSSQFLAPFAGVIAISMVIWYTGPQIAFGTSRPLESWLARLITILVIVLIVALSYLRKRFLAKKADKGIVEGIVDVKAAGGAPADSGRSQEEVAILKERFEKATEVLKKSKGKKGGLSL